MPIQFIRQHCLNCALTQYDPQKKKCDETRPRCSRCAERDQDCSYEPVRPRQRKKRESLISQALDSASSTQRRPTLGSEYDDDGDENAEIANIRSGQYRYRDEEAIEDGPQSLGGHLDASWPSASDHLLHSPLDLPYDFSQPQKQQDDVDEEIIRTDNVPQLAVTRAHRHYPDLAMISPAPLGSPHLEFVLPAFSEFSDCANRRSLVDHFANVLSHLIVLRETESGNPFQQLVLPLCYSSTTVQNAIYALSSAHLEHRSPGRNDGKSVYFHNQAIQGLARLIEMGAKADREELLAAIMLLVYFEVVCLAAGSEPLVFPLICPALARAARPL